MTPTFMLFTEEQTKMEIFKRGSLFNVSLSLLSNIFMAFGQVWFEWKFPPRDWLPTSNLGPTTLTT